MDRRNFFQGIIGSIASLPILKHYDLNSSRLLEKRIFYATTKFESCLTDDGLFTNTPGPLYDLGQLEIYENIEPIPNTEISISKEDMQTPTFGVTYIIDPQGVRIVDKV